MRASQGLRKNRLAFVVCRHRGAVPWSLDVLHAGGVKGRSPRVELSDTRRHLTRNPCTPAGVAVDWSLDILESERERKHEVTSPVFRFVRKAMATLKRESEHAGGVLRI